MIAVDLADFSRRRADVFADDGSKSVDDRIDNEILRGLRSRFLSSFRRRGRDAPRSRSVRRSQLRESSLHSTADSRKRNLPFARRGWVNVSFHFLLSRSSERNRDSGSCELWSRKSIARVGSSRLRWFNDPRADWSCRSIATRNEFEGNVRAAIRMPLRCVIER